MLYMSKKTILFIFILILLLLSVLITIIYHSTQKEDIYYYQSHRYFENAEYKKTIEYCKKVLEINPGNLDALNVLGYSHLWTGNYKEAIECFQKIVIFKPKDNEIKEQLAEAYSWNKEYEESISIYKEIVEDTDDIKVREKLARVCIWNGDFDMAKKELEIILEVNPKAPKARLLLAKLMHYSGETEKAVEVYEDLLEEEKHVAEKEPDAEEIKELLGEAYMISKDYEKAVKQYEDVLKEDPNNIKVRIELAEILSWEKQYDRAIEEYRKVLEIEPDHQKAKEKLADVFVWIKKYKEAEVLYKEIVEENPERLDVYASLAKILTWEKRYKEAIYFFDLALSKEEDEDMQLLYTQALLFSGDYERSKKVLEDIINNDPANLEAKEYLADVYAYSKEFSEAISLYNEILQETENPEVKRKLADVLSWNKEYYEAIDHYDEILSEGENEEARLQKARILGWAREYNKSIEEYQKILEIKYTELIELEMNAKKAYWNNRVNKAIGLYKELIEEDPLNVEAMFDLSQIYSYQSMWKDAKKEYEKILNVSPNHFRTEEALQKIELISSHLLLETGYEFLKAISQERDTDIKRHSLFGIFSYPLNYCLNLWLQYKHTWRSFTDFNNVFENEGRIEFSYMKKPNWWINGYYDYLSYNRNIDPMHTFGGSINLRTFDMGTLSLFYNRERLENSSTVIREGYYEDNYCARLFLDLDKRLKLQLDYLFSEYSDSNRKNEPSLEVFYLLSFEPKRFLIKYKFFYRKFKDTVAEYFSPENFWTHSVTFNWRQFLNKEEIFFGADDIYYDLFYTISVDSEDVVGHKFSGELNWDINKRVNLNIKGSITNSSNSVYKDRSFLAGLKIYF